MNGLLDIQFAAEILPALFYAMLVTLKIALLSSVIAIVLGFLGFLCQQSRYRFLSVAIRETLQFVRSTPLLIQVYFFYFILPEVGVDLEPLTAGSFVLGFHYSCYIVEVFRSALKAIPRQQNEAAAALGLRGPHLYRLVIFPQMLPVLVPGIGNAIIALVKDTPILSAISVMELLATTKEIGADSFRYFEPMTMCGIIYLAISYGLALVIQAIRTRFRWVATIH